MSGWTIVDRNTNKSLPWTGSGTDQAAYTVPSPGSQDPVGKMRISSPQSLIDTDFEYGQQPTKWESISLQNNRQSMYYLPQQSAPVTAVTGNGTRTVVVAMTSTANFTVGSPIFVQNALDPNANGWYYVQAVSTNVSVTYTAVGNVAAGNQFNAALTFVYPGYFYTGCGILLGSTSAFTYVGTTISCTTTSAHGLDAGSFIFVRGITSTAANAVNGWISGTTLSFNAQPGAGLALRTGYSVTGAGVTANTTLSTVNNVSFTADITGGTTLTRTAGTIPTVGMQLAGTGITPGTYILSGTDPTFTLSQAATNGTAIAVTGTNYTVNNSQTVGAIGSPVAITLSSTSVDDTPNGAYIVATVPTANTLTFVSATTPFGTLSNSANNTTLLARPSGFVESRSFDGGVAFSAGAIAPNQQLIRQTRRYFRYQSGKGLQFSTGTSLKPPLFVTSITSSGTTATVTTRFPHCMGVGSTVLVEGCEQGAYNGTFTIVTVPSATTFTYTMQATAVSPATGFPIRVIPNSWWGSSNRIGMFDLQNGLFFEFDGQQLYAVWRNSVVQIGGTVTVTNGSSTVTGTGTQFSSQLKPGDYIVIRGQSYRVQSINSNTQMLISPEYRGTTLTQGGGLISKTVDTRVPQSQWSDPLDGTGPSGYRLDLSRMQMFYIEYSWYGAGFARWGLRTTNGQITYVYQQNNNNLRFEAYMRSGNMAAHYESNGTSPVTFLTATLGTGGAGTTIFVNDASSFAPSGTVKITASGGTGVIEYITYTKVNNNQLTVVARAQTGGQGSAQTFTFSATAPIAVEFVSPDTNAPLSHWGSSVIMDGRFDDDKSLVFNYGMTTAVSTSNTNPIALMAIRIAPSVDNNTIGLLGAKEVINRMQLTLDSLGLYTTGTGYLINLVLNGFASGAGFTGGFIAPIQQANGVTSSLAQIALNTTAGITVTGGESVYAGYTNPTGVTTLDLGNVRDLGNSILGGGTTNTLPTAQSGFYPDGPDILYVVATPLSASASTILARINWKEAQA